MAILFGDIHLDNHADFGRPWREGCNTRLQSQLEVLARIFRICEEREDYSLVFLGDWYHRWRAVDTSVYSMVSRTLQDLLSNHPQVRLTMMPGNHDMPHKGNASVSTVDAYRAYPNVSVISEPTNVVIDGMHCSFVPYNQDHARMRDEALRLYDTQEGWLFSHIDIVGAVASIDGYVATDGVSLDDFDRFAGGVFGHYHMPQDFMAHDASEFIYVGAPMQLSWVDAMAGEEAEKVRGVIQLKNGIVTRIPIDSPRFQKITSDLKSDFRSQDYHLVTCKIDEADDLYQQVSKMGLPGNIRIMPVKAAKEGRSIVTRPTTASDAIAAYVKARGTLCELDAATLIGYGNYYLDGD